MKKWVKVLLIVALSFIAVGLILCGILIPSMIKNGGEYTRRFENMINGGGLVSLGNVEANLDGVEHIILEQGNDLLVFFDSSEQKSLHGEFFCYEDKKNESRLSFERDGNSLYIKVQRGTKTNQLIGGWQRPQELKLYLPKEYRGAMVIGGENTRVSLTKMTIPNLLLRGTGNMFHLQEIKCDTLTGDLSENSFFSVEDGMIDTLNLKGKLFNGSFNGVAHNVQIESNNAGYSLTLKDFPQTMSIGSTDSNLEINLPDNDMNGFSLMATIHGGELMYNIERSHQMSVYGTGEHVITYGMGEKAYYLFMQDGGSVELS